MRFLSVAERELRGAARRSRTYFVRWITGCAFLGLLIWLFWVLDGFRNRNAAPEVFQILSVFTFFYALFIGAAVTADCISSEKRDDTLGFLFLTNLKGYDVVTGKISIHAITTACGLLAVFPVFFLPILAGGVTWAETLRVLLGIAVSFLFALSLGVWISTRSYDARNAVLATLTTIFLIAVLPLLWMVVWDELFRGRPWLAGVPQLSPGMLLLYGRDEWYLTFYTKTI